MIAENIFMFFFGLLIGSLVCRWEYMKIVRFAKYDWMAKYNLK